MYSIFAHIRIPDAVSFPFAHWSLFDEREMGKTHGIARYVFLEALIRKSKIMSGDRNRAADRKMVHAREY